MACIGLLGIVEVQAQQPFLDPVFENPSVQEDNRMPMKVNYFPYESWKRPEAVIKNHPYDSCP